MGTLKSGGRNDPPNSAKVVNFTPCGRVLDPGEACRNRVTLSIRRRGSDRGHSLTFGLFEKNEWEGSMQMEDDVQVSGA